MKKLIISGSSKLYERALYWRGYFEGRGYDVIDWPCPITDDPDIAETPPTPGFFGRLLNSSDASYEDRMVKVYQRYWRNLDLADTFFLMNENRNNTEGYIGASAFSELTCAVINNLNRGKKTDIYILQMPAKTERCYDEVKFWLDQGWISIYHRPTGKKATIPIPDTLPEPSEEDTITEDEPSIVESPVANVATPTELQSALIIPTPATEKHSLFNKPTIDLMTCKKKALRPLTFAEREYLSSFSSDFPSWLLPYIAVPEFQRLKGVSMTTMDYSSLYQFQNFNSVFTHSIGVALIVWHFTRDKKQTLAGLYHDIASPSFKHAIDYMNGDSEKQESIESRTGEIIRNSRAITKLLTKDGILSSEISDYHLYPVADNDVPGLAADRLEYTFSNGFFLYDTWNLADIRRFYNNIVVLKNESGLAELGFTDPALASEFTERNLTLSANYHNEKARASLQIIADIIKSMISGGYLSENDLYVMNEREVIDWILSCGDHTLADTFRNFQRATSVYSGNTAKKNTYGTNVKAKVRYITPLVATSELDDASQPIAKRITDLNETTENAIASYLEEKQPKYVGFDFDFKPYAE